MTARMTFFRIRALLSLADVAKKEKGNRTNSRSEGSARGKGKGAAPAAMLLFVSSFSSRFGTKKSLLVRIN